jgi:hypothetical protein
MTMDASDIHLELRNAIQRPVEALILARTMGQVRSAFVDVFRSAYCVVVECHAATFPSRDDRERSRDLAHTIPLAACSFLMEELKIRPDLPSTLRPWLLMTLEALSSQVDPSQPCTLSREDRTAVEDMAALLHQEARLLAGRFMTDAQAAPSQMALAAARKERLDRFVEHMQTSGIKVTQNGIARNANVNARDVRRFLDGSLPEDSVMAQRIEEVLSGSTPYKTPIGFHP